ncbi:hypothetical protein EG329_004009 [Mollisiaceae sp. DMI_Dod_QoI]|nr:hypothetical protein EG329_004009 [Helotiales sp. DMI_Dod_QoI]
MSKTYDFLSDATKLKFHHGTVDYNSPYGRFLKTEQIRQKHAAIKISIKKREVTLEKYGSRTLSPYSVLLPDSNITLLSHKIKDLIRAIIDFTETNIKDELSKNSTGGLSAMRDSSSRWYQGLKKYAPKEPGESRFLPACYRQFDRLFFFGSLQNLCAIRFGQLMDTCLGKCYAARYAEKAMIPPTHACLIQIDNRVDHLRKPTR